MFHFRFPTAISFAARHAAVLRASSPILMLLSCLMLLGGCRLCADCDLDSYPSYGGAWQRTVRDSGRVGSIFDPGGSRASDLSARADSSELDARNRSALGSGMLDLDDEETSDPQAPENGERPDQGPGKQRGQDIDLQEMRERFRELDLQDINFRGPVVETEDWR